MKILDPIPYDYNVPSIGNSIDIPLMNDKLFTKLSLLIYLYDYELYGNYSYLGGSNCINWLKNKYESYLWLYNKKIPYIEKLLEAI